MKRMLNKAMPTIIFMHRQRKYDKSVSLRVLGLVGMFVVRLRQRIRIILTRTEVKLYTSLYDRSEGMDSVVLIKERLLCPRRRPGSRGCVEAKERGQGLRPCDRH